MKAKITHTISKISGDQALIHEKIEMPTMFEGDNPTVSDIQFIVDLREKATREALIGLGWTPPPKPTKKEDVN